MRQLSSNNLCFVFFGGKYTGNKHINSLANSRVENSSTPETWVFRSKASDRGVFEKIPGQQSENAHHFAVAKLREE